jgi:hypothetical protein
VKKTGQKTAENGRVEFWKDEKNRKQDRKLPRKHERTKTRKKRV